MANERHIVESASDRRKGESVAISIDRLFNQLELIRTEMAYEDRANAQSLSQHLPTLSRLDQGYDKLLKRVEVLEGAGLLFRVEQIENAGREFRAAFSDYKDEQQRSLRNAVYGVLGAVVIALIGIALNLKY